MSSKRREISKDELYDLYINRDMTLEEIRRGLGVGNHTLGRIMKEHNLVKVKRELKRTIKNKRLYGIWQGMKTRCYNTKDKSYSRYGGRGITIQDSWKNSFSIFYEWSMRNGYKDSLTIDRIDNSSHYGEDNCRWVDYRVQNNNKSDNLNLVYNNKPITIERIAEIASLNEKTIRNRINSGWCVDEIIKTPTLHQSEYKNKTSSKRVKQLSLNGDILQVFDSIREASELTNSSYHGVSKCIRGKQKTSNGFMWEHEAK